MAAFTTPENVSIAYDVDGDGPPLVLVHGITESRFGWDPLVAALAAEHRLIRLDLRGHGESGPGPAYDIAALASDVPPLLAHLGVDPAETVLVGHSLGGVVVTAVAGSAPFRGVVNVDQSLDLAGFQELLRPLEPMLRDPEQFAGVMGAVFETMMGPLPETEKSRVAALRRPDQQVVLAIWSPILDLPLDELRALVDAIAGAVTSPYLSLFGIDPGPGYPEWLGQRIADSSVEVWADHGHYPHLVEPTRFLRRLAEFEASLG